MFTCVHFDLLKRPACFLMTNSPESQEHHSKNVQNNLTPDQYRIHPEEMFYHSKNECKSSQTQLTPIVKVQCGQLLS